MTPAGSASFRDPENAAFPFEGTWHRIALPASAQALRRLRESDLYADLVGEGSLVSFDEVAGEQAARVLDEYRRQSGRPVPDEAVVFAVEPVELITYPWEWPNSLLEAAALLTLDLRRRLLGVGLDLKDASAFNVQFRGMRPVFIDLGSIEAWRPNPSWNASRQFIEHFINPLAVGSGDRVTAADAWALARHRGLRSEAARQLLPEGPAPQPVAAPAAGHDATRSRRTRRASRSTPTRPTRNPELAKNATLSLTRRLAKQVAKLQGREHSTTWVDYGTRGALRKRRPDPQVRHGDRIRRRPARVATGSCSTSAATTASPRRTSCGTPTRESSSWMPMRAPSTSCTPGSPQVPEVADRVTPVLGDLTNLTPASGLLDREFAAFTARVRPSAVICQAVLHHVVITQGTPMPFAVDALAAFGAPVQIEFATPDDEKSRLLISQIPNWSGDYSTEALVAALRSRYAQVEVVGTTSPTRVVVNAWDLLDAS